MDSDLEAAYNNIMDAVCPEDVFGELILPDRRSPPTTVLTGVYDRLRATVNPELYSNPSDKELAAEALPRLERFYTRAQYCLDHALYGIKQRKPSLPRPGRVAFKTAKREYLMGGVIATGTIADIFEGECATQDEFPERIVVKIVNSPADNELALREMKVLKLLHAANGPQRKHLPVLLDHFQTSDNRVGLIFRCLDESLDMHAILDHPSYHNGVDRKHMVWMLNRTLSTIGYAHNNGIVHGNIEPAHLMVRGQDHNVILIDWSWAAISPKTTGDQFKIFTEHFSAPEVKKHGSPHPASDIYSIGKCMIHVLGGDIATNTMPDSVEPELQRFIRYLVTESMIQRPHDAWDQWRYLDKLVRTLWGKKKFFPFET